MTGKSVLFIAGLLTTQINAEVFRCVDQDGRSSYQDTSCADEVDTAIDVHHTNRLDFSVPADDARTIRQLHSAREEAQTPKLRNPDAGSGDRLENMRRKIMRCQSLRADYAAMHIKRQRYGHADADAEAYLARRMRDACSG